MLFFWILCGVGAFVLGGALLVLFTSFRHSIRRGDMPSVREITELVREVKNVPRTLEPKTVFGATSIYLPMVQKDFPDYHNEEAIAAVRALVCEYLAIRYEGKEDFSDSRVSSGLLSTVDKGSGHSVKEETVHQVAMSRYVKTKEYATVTYQASVGYKLDGEQVEERYQAQYTLKLTDGPYAAKMLICPQCGGTFDNTRQTRCPFCDSAVVRDTWFSWVFTSITLS